MPDSNVSSSPHVADAATACPNGPDEYGHWPCDPDPHGDGTATCSICGYRARWLPICEHRVGDMIGWHNGEPHYECRRCGVIYVPSSVPEDAL